MTEPGSRPTVFVVATWFPSVDDPGAGRFVADQAEALAAAGRFRPAAISFDPVRLTGLARSRAAQAGAILDASRSTIREVDQPFARQGWSVTPGIPVARLSIPDGSSALSGAAHGAVHRSAILTTLGERLMADGASWPRTEARRGRTSVAEFDPDAAGIVHAHTGYPDGASAIALADALGWPLIVTEHASFVARLISTPELRAQYEAMLERADRVFAVSESLAIELRSAFPIHAATIETLPNAVPVDRFPIVPIAARRQDELLFVGYRKASKGIETLLRGVAIARFQRPSITLRLVGRPSSDESEAAWHALAKELAIADAVTFEPATDRSGVVAAMGRASVFVHASPRETFGVVVVEALASGMPVVVTDSGGVSEILGSEPERLGALVPVDDPEAFGAAILRTLDRRDAFDPVALRASVERRFGAEFVVERLHVAYREALGRWPSRGGLASRDRSPGRGVAPSDRVRPARSILIALDRSVAARRLGALPAELRSGITVVTSLEPPGVPLPSVGRLVEVAVEPVWQPVVRTGTARRSGLIGRLARLASDPLGTIRRRVERNAPANAWLVPATAAIRRILVEDGVDPGRLIPIEGHDALAAESVAAADPSVRSEVGLRGLADRWAADGGDDGSASR
ncbi:MAG: glycosyltransferase [Chloroflexi bacterium]|nr:glycosyltransferase [Chloroflexota bacterium]